MVLIVWHVLVVITRVPAFVFPPPTSVALTLVNKAGYLFEHSMVTTVEIVSGLLIGSALGVSSALLLVSFERSRRWAMPLMVMTQSLPVFALAPLLTLWFGYGMSSKIIMAVLIIYFPVVAASFDGLRHTPNEMLNLARSMRASKWAIIWHIRLPAAMPSMASGVRVATSVAPIGAVVGEWVGSSRGLGYVMLNANGRMQTDLMFAALLCLCVIAALLYSLVNRLLDRCLYWQKDSAISL
ncbi:MAG: putative hydroxymethylpyrimidine transport system permease protein [Pseudomonadales bacterium]